MKTTQKHFQIFQQECQKWINAWELNNWDIFYKVDTDKGTVAGIVTDIDGYVATIFFTGDWNNNVRPCNEEEIRLSAKHEVVHLLLGRLSDQARERFINKAEITEAEEELVRKLTKIIK